MTTKSTGCDCIVVCCRLEVDLLWPVGMDGQKSRDNSFAIVDLFISPELLHLFRDRAGRQKRREGEGD